MEMSNYASSVVSTCRPSSSSQNQGMMTVTTSAGELVLSDYGREHLVVYKPDPSKQPEWLLKTSYYHSMDGCGLIITSDGKTFYFDDQGTRAIFKLCQLS
jgi:hypothetical protein